MSSVVAIEHTAALFYSWSIRYIVNRAPVTPIDTLFAISSSIVNFEQQLKQQEGTRDCQVNSTGAN